MFLVGASISTNRAYSVQTGSWPLCEEHSSPKGSASDGGHPEVSVGNPGHKDKGDVHIHRSFICELGITWAVVLILLAYLTGTAFVSFLFTSIYVMVLKCKLGSFYEVGIKMHVPGMGRWLSG